MKQKTTKKYNVSNFNLHDDINSYFARPSSALTSAGLRLALSPFNPPTHLPTTGKVIITLKRKLPEHKLSV